MFKTEEMGHRLYEFGALVEVTSAQRRHPAATVDATGRPVGAAIAAIANSVQANSQSAGQSVLSLRLLQRRFSVSLAATSYLTKAAANVCLIRRSADVSLTPDIEELATMVAEMEGKYLTTARTSPITKEAYRQLLVRFQNDLAEYRDILLSRGGALMMLKYMLDAEEAT